LSEDHFECITDQRARRNPIARSCQLAFNMSRGPDAPLRLVASTSRDAQPTHLPESKHCTAALVASISIAETTTDGRIMALCNYVYFLFLTNFPVWTATEH
jgi:hypothetical protein